MKIAIQGHPTRGKEIIQILKSLGATSYSTYDKCSHPELYWYINKNREITCDPKRFMFGYKLYTLEEFEKEFPFKVGDVVVTLDNKSYKIVTLEYYNNKMCYKLDNGFYYRPQILKPYEKMKEERNITLTLDKAKEWYNKGGELKEIALQAFSEKELTEVELPETWEEFCNTHPTKKGEYYIDSCSEINSQCESAGGRDIEMDKNVCPSRKSAEAHLAMIQLEQLRDCWRQGWKPEWKSCAKYSIKNRGYALRIIDSYNVSEFLAFPTREMAEEFLECFKDLIEKAGDLI